jgi:RimJ/RimL family protein N-acetyltransferase
VGTNEGNQLSNPIVLETPRLRLRQFTLDDAEVFLRLGSDPEIIRYTGDPGLKSLDEARASMLARPLADYAKYGYGRLACVLKSSGAVIGFNGLKYLDDLKETDLGYRLLPEYWGMGLATEAARAALDFGFHELRLPRIIAMAVPENAASVRVLQKLGMTFVEMIEQHGDRVAKYAIDPSQWAVNGP